MMRSSCLRAVRAAMAAGILLMPGIGRAQNWQQPTSAMAGAPAPRQNASAIYDQAGDRMVLFGGRSSSGDLADAWVLDLSALRWRQLSTTGTAPSPRHTHNAVLHRLAQEMLIWSGRSIDAQGTQLHNDVHALDLTTSAWRLIQPATAAPVARYGTAAIFDAAAGELVNFAGFTELGRFDDTWRLDPTTGIWREVTMDQRPGQRCLHTAAYDAVGERMIVFGGQRGADALDDVWSLDLRTDTWHALPPMPAGGRRFPAAAFDVQGGRFYTFGGERNGARFGDLWSLAIGGDRRNGAGDVVASAWEQVAAEVDVPPVRDRAVLIYDERRHRLVLFGGTGEEGHLNDTWVLTLPQPTPTFVRAVDDSEPTLLALPAIYPNPFNGQVLIQVQVPPAQQGHLMVYDLLGQRVRDLGAVQGLAQRTWDATTDAGRGVASGVYLVHLQTEALNVQRRVVLIR